jgi:hypothetical protein
MTKEAQSNALGLFEGLGFALQHEGDEVALLFHEGKEVCGFGQVGATRSNIQAQCAQHLVAQHHWDGCLWSSQGLNYSEKK